MSATALLGPLLCLTAAAPPEPAYALETAEAKRVRGTLTFKVDYDDAQVKEWVVFVARAPELPSQAKPSTKLEPAGIAVSDLSPLRRPLLMARVAGRTPQLASSLPLKLTYEATLFSRRLVALPADAAPPKVAPLPAAERQAALEARADFDFRAEAFKKWLDDKKLARGKDEAEIAYARRVFQAVRRSFAYDYRPDLDRKASGVCQGDRADCGGLSVLFVSALRAHGIPARTLVGRWAKSSIPGDRLGAYAFHQWHVKAEFHAAGVGWVPADPTLAILLDRSADAAQSFGSDPGEFLTFHVDPGLEVNTVLFGRQKVTTLQNPHWWVSSRNRLTSGKVVEDWKVEVLK